MYRIARLISAGLILWVGAVSVAQAASLLGGRASVGRSDEVAAARRVIQLAQRGDAHAQAVLGFMYANGRGVPQSHDVAIDWYLQAAAHAPRQNREYILRLREAVASKMTRAQLDVGQQLAVDFIPSR